MLKFPLLANEPSVLMPAPTTLAEVLLRLLAVMLVLPCAAMRPLLVTLAVTWFALTLPPMTLVSAPLVMFTALNMSSNSSSAGECEQGKTSANTLMTGKTVGVLVD